MLGGARPARASVDVTGTWGVTFDSFLGQQLSHWAFQQTGTQITLTITVLGDVFPGTIGPGSGTIDPDTGVFSVDLPDTIPPPPALPCPDNRIDGTASADGLSIAGTLVFYSVPTRGCLDAGGEFTGTRCSGTGTAGCCESGECCGNGTVEGSEACDAGAGDACCSPSCQPRPAGTACQSDGNECTDDVCGAGSCQHLPNTASCSGDCVPGGVCAGGICVGDPAPPGTPCTVACGLDATCIDGACVPGSPAPAGTPCDDGDRCAGDRCDALGTCVDGGVAADCAPCERCNPAGGCVAAPRASCNASSKSRFTLILEANKKKLDWRATSLPDPSTGIFRNPVLETEYAMCVFDQHGIVLRATARPTLACGEQSCWKPRGTGGFRFNDPSGQANGLVRIDLSHRNQTPKERVRGKGENLPSPNNLHLVQLPLVVQLQATDADGGACWEDRYDAPLVETTQRSIKARRR